HGCGTQVKSRCSHGLCARYAPRRRVQTVEVDPKPFLPSTVATAPPGPFLASTTRPHASLTTPERAARVVGACGRAVERDDGDAVRPWAALEHVRRRGRAVERDNRGGPAVLQALQGGPGPALAAGALRGGGLGQVAEQVPEVAHDELLGWGLFTACTRE